MRRDRGAVFGVKLRSETMPEALRTCTDQIRERVPVQHVVLNAGKVVLMEDVPRLREVVASCDVIHADGQSIVWAGRLLGVPVPERVAGIDLMARLLEEAEREEWPVFLLGATAEILEEFICAVRRRFPRLRLAGSHDGYFDDDGRIADLVRESGARLLFVAMPSPRKEFFLANQLERMGPVFAMGVGGSFDVWAGKTKRAPRWMQRAGLEWLYRFLQEPRRMWRRYLVGNTRFLMIVAREWLGRRRAEPLEERPEGADQ